MTAGEYAKSIDGVRLLARHDTDPASVTWDFRTAEGFPAASVRALFQDLPGGCHITFLDPNATDQSFIFLRRDDEHLIVRKGLPGRESRWQEEEWEDVVGWFLRSPLVLHPQSGVTAFTVTEAAPPVAKPPSAPPPKKTTWGFTIPIIAVVLLLLGCAWYVMGPGGDGVVSYLKTPDGTECLVTQEWNGWDKFDAPYTVDFYFRKPGGGWGLCEIDNGANRWPSSKMIFIPKTQIVEIYHGNLLHSKLDLRTNRFVYFSKIGLTERETAAPQFNADPPFPPPGA